jgi:hypothetical protein
MSLGSSRISRRPVTHTRRFLVACAVVLLGSALSVADGFAHGVTIAASDDGVRAEDGVPWLIRPSQGVVRATAAGWEYICATQFGSEAGVFVMPRSFVSSVVIGQGGTFLVPVTGDVTALPTLPFESSSILAVHGDEATGAFLLARVEGITSLWTFDPEPRQIFAGEEAWGSLYVTPDGVGLGRASETGFVLGWMTADETLETLELTVEMPPTGAVSLRYTDGQWVLVSQHDDVTLVSTLMPASVPLLEVDGWSILGEELPTIGGPMMLNSGLTFVSQGQWVYAVEGALETGEPVSWIRVGGSGEQRWGISTRRLSRLGADGTDEEILFDVLDVTSYAEGVGLDEETQQRCLLNAYDFAFETGLPLPEIGDLGFNADVGSNGQGAEDETGESSGCATVPAGGAAWYGALMLLALVRRKSDC